MDMRKIKKLIELLQSTGVAEIEIHEGEESVRITRESKSAPIMMTQPVMPTPGIPAAPPMETSKSGSANQAGTTAAAESHAEKQTLKAPMVGTVYLSPTPGAKPFV